MGENIIGDCRVKDAMAEELEGDSFFSASRGQPRMHKHCTTPSWEKNILALDFAEEKKVRHFREKKKKV